MSKLSKQSHLPNRLTRALASVCRGSPLTEKWLIAPSRRVGAQWIERIVALGTPVVNVRVWTMKGLAVHLAGPLIAAKKLRLFPQLAGPILASRLWKESGAAEADAYLSVLESSPGAAGSLFRTLHDLRLAGLDEGDIEPALFEVDAKGREIGRLLARWTAWLDEAGYVDYAAVLSLARQALSGRSRLPADLLLLIPADTDRALLEQEMIDAFRPGVVRELPVDLPGGGDDRETSLTDRALLGWVRSVPDAPAPRDDRTATIFSAVGAVNEVRHVFRCCLEHGLRLDQVELIHSHSDTYLHLIYETLACVAEDAAGFEMDMPATFAEGVPACWLRPGRALAGWVSWIRSGFIQKTVKEMIHGGLLEIDLSSSRDASRSRMINFSNLAGLFARLPIGFGRDRYLDAIGQKKRTLRKRGERERTEEPTHGDRLDRLENLLTTLIGTVPEPTATPEEIVECALRVLRHCARSVSRFDRNAQKELVREITNTLEFVKVEGAGSLDAWDWLDRLPGRVRVEGSGPRPGCIHVANISAAGHSGRPFCFIIGLDDSRFPGGGNQDPLLLDSERKRLSRGLPTAEESLASRTGEFESLLARLRGTVYLGYSRRDLVDDRDLFPSGLLLSAFRILSGQPQGDQVDLEKWIDPAATFVPASAAQSLDRGEWWFWRLCGSDAVEEAENLVRACYPDLDRGFRAAAARRSAHFTEWDGRVPLAGTRHDPFEQAGPILSASALEKIGACPRSYFFRYVLGISRPDEIAFDPARWLDPMASGSLLHDVFHRFVSELIEHNRWPPSFERDWSTMSAILFDRIGYYRSLHPVCSESVFQAEVREIEKGARNFLRSEEIDSSDRRPLFLEASIGMGSFEGGSGIDSAEPVRLELVGGRAIRARGRIDRIDEHRAAPGRLFELWDYKAGGTWKFTQGKVFAAGRVVQHALYVSLVGARLRAAIDGDARVERFGYFFPGVRGQGERLTWTARDLSGWRPVVDALCRIVSEGAFLHTADRSRCSLCDYQSACGESPAAAGSKLDEDSSGVLEPIVELQEYD